MTSLNVKIKKIFKTLLVFILIFNLFLPATASYAATTKNSSSLSSIFSLFKPLFSAFTLNLNTTKKDNDTNTETTTKKAENNTTNSKNERTYSGNTYTLALPNSKINALLSHISKNGYIQKGKKSYSKCCDNIANYYIDYLFDKAGTISPSYGLKSNYSIISVSDVKKTINKGGVVRLHTGRYKNGEYRSHWVVVIGYNKNSTSTSINDLLVIDPYTGGLKKGGDSLVTAYHTEGKHRACYKSK